jgi:hypothetical protein
MSNEQTYPFPRRWSEMSFDTKLFFAFHVCIMVMFVLGGALTVSLEIAIALGLSTIALIASVLYRYREGWRWRGVGLKQALGAIGGIALVGLMFVAVGQFGSYTNPHILPWFIACVGIGTFNAPASLRLVQPSETEFAANVRGNLALTQTEAAHPAIAEPAPRAVNLQRNTVAGVLAAYGFVSFFVFIWLDFQWVHLAPTQPTQNLVYVHNEHGSYVYFSAFQATTCALMFWTSIPLAFVGMFVAPKKNVQKTVRWYAARMTWDKDDPAGASDWAFWITAILTPPLLYLVGRPLVEWLNTLGFVVSIG